MSNISTEDCKDFLVSKFPHSKRALWKRERKYKNDSGDWCRDFSNPDVGNVSLVEVNGILGFFKKAAVSETTNSMLQRVLPVHKIELKSHDIFVKTFTEDDLELASNLVGRFIESGDDPRATAKGFFAVPSQFTYSFTDVNGDESGNLSRANRNLDINTKFNTFNLYLTPIEHDDYDQHLQPLLQQFFPRQCGEEMECVFGFYYDNPISIKDFVIMMSKQGFKYEFDRDDRYDDRCLLKDIMRTFNFVEGQTIEEAFKPVESSTVTQETTEQDSVTISKPTLVTTIDLFCNIVKDDNAVALEKAIADGLDLSFMINRISMHSYCLNNDLHKCFKVLVQHTKNLAVGHNGEANTVWRDAILFTDDSEFNYIQYLLEHANYDFTKESYLANAAFVYFLHSIDKLEEKFDKLNEMYAACICYANAISNEDFYNNEFVKKQVRKALFDYADFSNSDMNVAIALTNDVIISEVLDVMIEKGDVCIAGKTLRVYLTMVVDRFKHGFWGYDEIERKDNIVYYENALKKIGGI